MNDGNSRGDKSERDIDRINVLSGVPLCLTKDCSSRTFKKSLNGLENYDKMTKSGR